MIKALNGWSLDSIVAPGATLNQGDLIRFEDEQEVFKKHGLVVT